jgi:hypothetical protein
MLYVFDGNFAESEWKHRQKCACVTPSKANVTVMKGDVIAWPLTLTKSAKIAVEICLRVTAGKFGHDA